MPSGRKKLGEQNPSTYCRSCWKYLAPDPLSLTSGKRKQSKASLHYPLTNKEFTTPLGVTHITLNSILENWGTSVNSNDGYSQAFCMSCARSLVRTFATQTKLVQNINKSPPGIAVKRFSSGSPSAGRSPLAVLEKKRSRLQTPSPIGSVHPGSSQFQPPPAPFEANIPKRNLGEQFDAEEKEAEKENVPTERASRKSIQDALSSRMNLEKDQEHSIIKVFIGFPSGKIIEHDSFESAERRLLTAVAKKDPKKAASAIMLNPTYRLFLTDKFSKCLSDEAVSYFKSENCLKMKKSSPSEIAKFRIENLESEVSTKMPVTFKFLEALTGVRARKLKEARRERKKKQDWKKGIIVEPPSRELDLQRETTLRCNLNTICNVTAMCLRQYFANMSKLAYRNTLLLLNGGCRSLDIKRLNMQGITMSHSAAIRMQYRMAKEFGKSAIEWSSEVKVKEEMILLLKEINQKMFSEESGSVKISDELASSCESYSEDIWSKCKAFVESRHPDDKNPLEKIDSLELLADEIAAIIESIEDYSLVEDNCDLFLVSRHQTTTHQNQSLHWALHFAVKGRLKRPGIDQYSKPQGKIADLQIAKLLPSKSTIEALKSTFPHLVGRVIAKYLPAYKKFKSTIVRHIPHRYSNEMARPSNQCHLGLMFKNPNISGDMAEILKHLQENYVPRIDENILKPIIMHGDQLTEERGRHVQWTFRFGPNAYKQLKGLEITFAEFHMVMCLFEVNNKIFLKSESGAEIGTTQSLMTRTNSSNAKKGPKRDYNAYKDFHLSETEGHILSAWMKFSGMESIEGSPQERKVPRNILKGNLQDRKQWLNNEINEFLKEFVFDSKILEHLESLEGKLTELRQYELTGYLCRFPGCNRSYRYHSGRVKHERQAHEDEVPCTTEQMSTRSESNSSENKKVDQDHILNYHTARLRFGLMHLYIRDAIHEGDGQRLLLIMPYLVLLFHLYKRTKYAYVSLLHLVKVHTLLPKGIAHELVNERFWNSSGGRGKNIPLDLRMEHMVRLLKLSLKQLGANVGPVGAQRIAQSLGHVEEMLQNIDIDTNVDRGSGHHSSKHLQEVVLQVANDLNSAHAFEFVQGHSHSSFPKFSKNLLENLDFTECYSWISRLLKVWEAVYES